MPASSQTLDAVPVPDVKHLQCLAARPEVESAIGQDPIDVQHQQANGGGPAHWHDGTCGGEAPAQTTPARNRSCTFSAPTSRPCVVRNRQRGDAMHLHQMHGLRRQLSRADGLAVRRS